MPMTLNPSKGYQSLRRGRISQEGREYFVTFCTRDRQSGLTSEKIAQGISREISSLETDATWVSRCAVIMPDHVHLLIRLGNKLTLGRAIARLKAKSVGFLKTANLRWQEGFHEHRLRPHEMRLPVFLYTYLNPYRAGLIPLDSQWPWFYCSKADSDRFLPMLSEELPEPAWLGELP